MSEFKYNAKEMEWFRMVYIQELMNVFDSIERIEDDEDEPYNVVFVLKGNRRVKCQTYKHYEMYQAQCALPFHSKEETVSHMRNFIQSIAPVKSHSFQVINDSFETIRYRIFPILRPIVSMPAEAIMEPWDSHIGIYYALIFETENKTHYMIVMESMIQHWGITCDILKQTAFQNLLYHPPSWMTYATFLEQRGISSFEVQQKVEFHELVMVMQPSSLASSYMIAPHFVQQIRDSFAWKHIILSAPFHDTLYITDRKNIVFFKQWLMHLLQNRSDWLMTDIWEWKEEAPNKMESLF